MSVSALNNTNYYIPTISTKPASNEAANVSSASAPTQVQQVDENNTKIQATPDSYAANQQNTLSNTPVYTGEEMLSALNQDKQAQNSQTAKSSQTTQSAQKQQTTNTGEKVLTEEEQKQVEELKARDTEVKAHEQAHIAAGGSYVRGGAKYDYQTGPDGKKYAVGGEVSIDTSAVEGDPQATINKAQVILKAALAPAEPSGQDKAVASQARQMMASARKELMSEKINTNSENTTAAATTTENSTSASASSENSKTENKAPVTVDTAPKMNTQSLKSDSVNIPQVNVAGSGLYQAFSNAGMSPIKNANALMQVAGSLISMMA